MLMPQHSTVASPRLEARVAGFLYLLIIILGGFAEIGVRQGLVVTWGEGARVIFAEALS